MMRKKTKMAWSVALSAAMAAGLLAGCGSNGGAESTSGSTAASSAKTESSASDTTDTSDRPTYKIATVRWTDTWPTDFLKEGVMKEIEDKMNINIDWQVTTVTGPSRNLCCWLPETSRMHFLAPSA